MKWLACARVVVTGCKRDGAAGSNGVVATPADAAPAAPPDAPAQMCTKPIALAGSGWTADLSFKQGNAVISAKSGTAPAGALGAKPLIN